MIFATRAAVLVNGSKSGGRGWVTLKGAGWPEFLVHSGGLEATIGAFDGLITGNTMLHRGLHDAAGATLDLATSQRKSRLHQNLGHRWGTLP